MRVVGRATLKNNPHANSFVKEISRPERLTSNPVHGYHFISYSLVDSFEIYQMSKLWSLSYLIYWGISVPPSLVKGSLREEK